MELAPRVFGVGSSPLDMLEVIQFLKNHFLVSLQLGSNRSDHGAMLARLVRGWNQGWDGGEFSKLSEKFVVRVFFRAEFENRIDITFRKDPFEL